MRKAAAVVKVRFQGIEECFLARAGSSKASAPACCGKAKSAQRQAKRQRLSKSSARRRCAVAQKARNLPRQRYESASSRKKEKW